MKRVWKLMLLRKIILFTGYERTRADLARVRGVVKLRKGLRYFGFLNFSVILFDSPISSIAARSGVPSSVPLKDGGKRQTI